MNISTLPPSPLEAIISAQTTAAGIELYVKRDDLIHPYLSGNKWRKLKYNLQEMQRLGQNTMLTFGGAFSNHIHAVAAAGKHFDFNTIGIIRGDEHDLSNATLAYAANCGMKLEYVSREDYRMKSEPHFLPPLRRRFGDFYVLPEGGSNALALPGCREIAKEIDINFDYITVACGTGATLAGIVQSLTSNQVALGFEVLKVEGYFENQLDSFLGNGQFDPRQAQLIKQYHFGGYAKVKKPLVDFITWFEDEFHIALEPIYTGKMMFGLFDLIETGYFPRGSKIVAVHTGGLQGLAGMKEKIDRLKKRSI